MKLFITFLSLCSFLVFGQNYTPKTIAFEQINFAPPMDIPMILAGNFGEMRSNHFHTGLDIKTLGVEGQKVRAIEDGYISRVRVSPWGYGNAIYIDHFNGTTSVYAHLSTFPDAIDSLFHAQHTLTESHILDENVLLDSFFVKKGQLIAYSGNSGSSSAPHLHFEIRETSSEHALNPLLFSCYRNKISDNTPPHITGIKMYAVTDKGYMVPGKSVYFYAKKQGKNWVINSDNAVDISELITENTKLAFGFHTTDKLDGAGNVCGVHHTIVSKDGVKKHEQQIDYIDFANNRYLNSHQDYFEFKQNRRNIHKQFTTELNPLSIYLMNDGKIDWQKCAGSYTFEAIDVHKNKSVIHFKIEAPKNISPAKNPFHIKGEYFFPDSVNTFLEPEFQVLMEPGSFYEPLQKIYRVDTASTYLSPIYQFGEYSIPVQQKFDVRIKAPNLPANFPFYKLGIGVISDRGELSFLGGSFVGGWVEAQPRTFGKFVILVDSIPPLINPLDFNEGKTITKYNTLELEINDNIAGVMEYKAYLNGKWVLMIYNRKKNRYIIPLDKYTRPILEKGKNKVRIYAKDGKGNESEKSYTLNY